MVPFDRNPVAHFVRKGIIERLSHIARPERVENACVQRRGAHLFKARPRQPAVRKLDDLLLVEIRRDVRVRVDRRAVDREHLVHQVRRRARAEEDRQDEGENAEENPSCKL